MAGGTGWWRRVVTRARSLRGIARDTQRALQDVTDILPTDPQVCATIQEVSSQASRSIAIVILGTSGAARVRLLHCLLGRKILPEEPPRGMRWVRVQFGSSVGLQLTVGSDFELVDELHTAPGWDTVATEDLVRDSTDLSTILEVELNNPFLKDGLKIILPPDLEQDLNNLNSTQIKELHSQLYAKREMVLKTYNCVYMYAIDRISKSVFSESIWCEKMAATRSEEDFWNNFSLYPMRSESESASEKVDRERRDRKREEMWDNKPAVFTPENCLDLQQIKHINPHSQVLFALFSDCVEIESDSDMTLERDRERRNSATESTESKWSEEPEADQGMSKEGWQSSNETKDERRRYEQQTAFMNELLDQWEIMTSPPPKHYVKSQWSILSYADILRTPENKVAHPSSTTARTSGATNARGCTYKSEDRTLRSKGSLVSTTVRFAADCFHTYLLDSCTRLSETHVSLVQRLVLASLDLSRELQVVPRKIHYVSHTERRLYQSITSAFSGSSRGELVSLIQQALQEMAREVERVDWTVHDSPCHQDRRFHMSNSVFYSTRSSPDNISFSIPLRNTTHLHDNNQSSINHTGSAIIDSTSLNQNTSPTHQNTSVLDQNTSVLDQNTSVLHQNTSVLNQNTSVLHHDTIVLNQKSSIDVSQDIPSDGEEAMDDSDCYSYNIDDYEVIDYNDVSLSLEMRPMLMNSSLTSSPLGEIRVADGSQHYSLWSDTIRTPCDGRLLSQTSCTNSFNVSLKHASLDVQKTVLSRLSRKISVKLVQFVDCLKDSYFGTLQRCLSSLERSCRRELGGRPASQAMAALRAGAANVDLQRRARYSLARSLLDGARTLFHRLRLGVGGSPSSTACCPLSAQWRRHTAVEAVRGMSADRLADAIARQILERLSEAHERYQSALAALQAALETRLTHTEDVKLTIRKKSLPVFARLCLESTSLCDLLRYGVPELGREIGRGQYGVVYSVRGHWGRDTGGSGGNGGGNGGGTALAVKSVLPHDTRHYHDLAMEFFYTRSIPPHPRIVPLLGSVLQGDTAAPAPAPAPAVLLLSPRRRRDLHAALRLGLRWPARLRVTLDIVEGIRYLHSLGLVHRDIKMKNVLLDGADRAALTDLGFCACEALLTGSVVGTPVHMAPELLAGDYHMPVDVYAFGILFWYVCAGSVKLPAAFDSCQSKEQLWVKVKRGLRPERLPHFSDSCWSIMESCWHSDPAQRALLGDVQRRLERELVLAAGRDGGDEGSLRMTEDTDTVD